MIRLLAPALMLSAMTAPFANGAGAQESSPAKRLTPPEDGILSIPTAAARFKMMSADGDRQYAALKQPVLRWSKHTYEDVSGEVYLWTDRSVPAAIASVFRFTVPKDDLTAEFHSLSTAPLRAEVTDRVVWKPGVAGIRKQTLIETEAPSPQTAVRKTQIRNLARQFSAERQIKEDVVQLRLLPKPIWAYSAPDQGIADGALFAFVDQTDPEILLLIEAVEETGSLNWNYALARFNSNVLRVKRGGAEVWRAETYDFESLSDSAKPYFLKQRLQDDPAFTK